MSAAFAIVLALLVAPEPEAVRPPNATRGTAVAKVLRGKEKVVIADGQTTFEAKPGLPLLKTDTVKVPKAGFALLQLLGNGYVVRVDEDLELSVADIALLDAPKQTLGASAQLETLLDTEERRGFEKERLIGWYVTPTAAVVPSTPMEKETKTLPRPAGGKDPLKKAPPGKVIELDAKLDVKPSPPPAPAQSGEALRAPLAGDAKLIECLSAELATLGVRKRVGDSVQLRFTVDGQKVAVTLRGALPAPPCAHAWFAQHGAELKPGTWYTVRLK